MGGTCTLTPLRTTTSLRISLTWPTSTTWVNSRSTVCQSLLSKSTLTIVSGCMSMAIDINSTKWNLLPSRFWKNWKLYENSADFLNLMKNCPKAVLEIMSKLHKGTDCQPLILANVKPSLVDF